MDEFDFLFSEFLKLIGINLPSMIALVVAIGATWTFWNRHPPAARRLLFALFWMLGTNVLACAWHTFGVALLLERQRIHVDQYPYLLILSSMEGLGYIFFLIAVNVARVPYRSPQYYDYLADDEKPP